MKIEKVNENQIRCTLTREDLASRELKISELAYGTEKAKSLFRDMMQQANFEFGFEAEDIPLMIEAIPLNAECIVLIITKVEDPEELDTRFSRFAPSVTEDSDEEDDYDEPDSVGEISDLFRRLQDRPAAPSASPSSDTVEISEAENIHSCIFRMESLNDVLTAAAVTGPFYTGQSTLYKDDTSGKYLLLLTQQADGKDSYDRACNILSEYGTPKRFLSAGRTFLEEHYEALAVGNALQVLGNLGNL